MSVQAQPISRLSGEEEGRQTILVVEDDTSISLMTGQILKLNGYSVLQAEDGEEALKMVREKEPDLVLLDVKMPKMNGFEVCERIKDDPAYQHIPVLMLTTLGDHEARIRGLDLGADDYIVKPFNNEELIARVRSALRRSRLNLDASPLTHLPGNSTIERMILKNIREKRTFALLYADLNFFKAYNDLYGFSKGDEVIRATAKILLNVTDADKDFVGHIGGDDFVVLTVPDRAEALCQEIIRRFDKAAADFYAAEDLKRGFVETKNRQGKSQRSPLLSIAIGVVINKEARLGSMGMISRVTAEIKQFAKKNEGSAYAIDRRHGL